MLAVVYDGTQLQVSERSVPELRDGEALVRPTLVGICNTDLEILRGYANFSGILGHEFVGVVERCTDPAFAGQRVVGEINITCGKCDMCRIGRREHCLRRSALGIRGRDGALAEYVALPVTNLHLVPRSVPDDAAVFAEPLAAACKILEQVHVHPLSRVVVLGDGKLGLLVAQVLALTGADLIVAGRHEDKLAILSRRGIATTAGDPLYYSGADLVVECTGRAEGFHTALELVRPGGTLVLKSTYHGQIQADLSRLVVDEITVVGSRCGPFATALRYLEMGLVEVVPLIAARYRLADAAEAFHHAALPGTLKVLVHP
ncbi:MAG TPA: alcohol dehydrogenase catalytic domain-containing protein [Anaerolineae bacterium]|nr:alcohol dehydrogenase catalytic domain-containing protein [Anaerolineae bacterium]